MENDELRALVHACQRKDQQSQKKLYDQFSAMLFAICLRYAKTRAEAEDALIDAYQQIFLKLDAFEYENSSLFVGWMKKITLNRALSNYHNNKAHNNHFEIESDVIGYNTTDHATATQVAMDAKYVLKLIQQLPEWASTIINLIVIDEYRTEDVAQMLNITVATTRSRLSKARVLLKKRLEKVEKI